MRSSIKAFGLAWQAVGLSVLVLSVNGCASDAERLMQSDPAYERPDTPELIGVYERDASDSVYVSEEAWSIGADAFSVESLDPLGDFAILKNNAKNDKNGGKYSRADWTIDADGQVRLCIAISDAGSEAAATAKSPNASDLDEGCNGASWSTLSEPELSGAFTDDWAGQHDITSVSWSIGYEGSDPSVFWLLEVSTKDGYFLAQNDEAIEATGGKYSRFDYLTAGDGKVYYCQTVYDAATLDAARATKAADQEDLESGCATFPWSKLTPKD